MVQVVQVDLKGRPKKNAVFKVLREKPQKQRPGETFRSILPGPLDQGKKSAPRYIVRAF